MNFKLINVTYTAIYPPYLNYFTKTWKIGDSYIIYNFKKQDDLMSKSLLLVATYTQNPTDYPLCQ